MYRFKLKEGKRLVFRSPWLDVDLLEAIALKDNYIISHPEYNGCSVKWEKRGNQSC